MAFPDDPLTVLVELNVGGVWTDITGHVYLRDPITITRGQADEGAQVDPATCSLTLNNRDGRYSPRNPRGPYYGLIGRNTPVRVSAQGVVRFVGEISAWPPRWDISGQDVWAGVEAAGVLRRLGQGARPLGSALTRTLTRLAPTGYWPMEDAAGSTVVATPIPGGSPLRVIGSAAFGQDVHPVGSAGALTMVGSSQLTAPVSGMPATGGWVVGFWMSLPPEGGGYNNATDGSHLVHWQTPNASVLGQWYAYIFPGNGGRISIGAFNHAGDNQIQNSAPIADLRGTTSFVLLHGHAVGANTIVDLYVNGVLDDALIASPSTPGTITNVGVNTQTQVPCKGTLSHLVVDRHTVDWSYRYVYLMHWAGHGYTGEAAGRRIERLCAEETVPLQPAGNLDESAALGPQRTATLLDLLGEAADADQGLLYEQRDAAALAYRTRVASYSTPPALTAAYGQLSPPLEPVDDDAHVRNDLTITRDGGSSARAVLLHGPLSVQAPPAGVGSYDEAITLNLGRDDQLPDQAHWRLHLGTWDETRYPAVTLDLAAHPDLIAAATAVHLRDRIRMANPPPWLPPGPVDLQVTGYTETIGLYEWAITYTCAPAGPWQVGHTDDPVYGRADTTGSQLTYVVASGGPGEAVLISLGSAGDNLTAPDSAALSVIGDLDVGIEVTCHDWQQNLDLIAKWVTAGDQRSWALYTSFSAADGKLIFEWTTNGTAGTVGTAISTAGVPFPDGTRGAVRVTLDVDNGAAGRTITFSTAASIAGPWTVLGGPVVQAGTTSIFDGTAACHIGGRNAAGPALIHAAQIRGGIGGAVVGNPDLRTQAEGVTSFADTAPVPQTWTVNGAAAIIDAESLVVTTTDGPTWTTTPAEMPFDVQAGGEVMTVMAISGAASPQLFSVTRSVNGVVKPHAAGTGIRLAHPMTLSL